MPHEFVVFLGPTLPWAEAGQIIEAVLLPPADQGAFVRAMRQYRPRAIVLIDGAFGKVPAVRHKEILWTLAQGVAVFGAASMGALRAAELFDYGMCGHGFIYRWYRRTPLADDDEVAVAMTPSELGAEPLSESLINIRLTLRLAVRRGILADAARHWLEQVARATHFVDRSYPRLLADAKGSPGSMVHGSLERLRDWLPENAIDVKREDAVDLLTWLSRNRSSVQAPRTSPFRMTEAWAYDLDAAGLLTHDISDIA